MSVVGSILSTTKDAAIAQAEVTYQAAEVTRDKAVAAANAALAKANDVLEEAKDHLKDVLNLKVVEDALADLGSALDDVVAAKVTAKSELDAAKVPAPAAAEDTDQTEPGDAEDQPRSRPSDHLKAVTSQMKLAGEALEKATKAVGDISTAVEGHAAAKEAAEQAVQDASGAKAIAEKQKDFDIKTAMAELAKASDAKFDAIEQAETDYNKAKDRPNPE